MLAGGVRCDAATLADHEYWLNECALMPTVQHPVRNDPSVLHFWVVPSCCIGSSPALLNPAYNLHLRQLPWRAAAVVHDVYAHGAGSCGGASLVVWCQVVKPGMSDFRGHMLLQRPEDV